MYEHLVKGFSIQSVVTDQKLGYSFPYKLDKIGPTVRLYVDQITKMLLDAVIFSYA